jgi:hypothetical protein
MNHVFYEQWCNSRVNKIIDVLGNDWFPGKQILELGACHGDIGIPLLKLGADVTFSDVREENLQVIKDKFTYEDFVPKTIELNQNFEYNLNKKYDLVLHLGTLYHVENWKQDLQCALNHSNIMFLETVVSPFENMPDMLRDGGNYKYDGYNCKEPLFTQESVEKTLTELGCKFIRFDNQSLNSNWNWLNTDSLIKNVYDWNYDNVKLYTLNTKTNQMVHFRRMWMVIK